MNISENPTAPLLVLSDDLSVLLYGPTGSGKSTLAAELAKHLFKTQRKRTAIFLADEGSRRAYDMLERAGVATIYEPKGNIWIWINHALKGEVKEGKGYKSVTELIPDLGLIIHEGLTSYAELMMQEMAKMSADNINVGGDGVATVGKDKDKDGILKAWKIEVKGDGETLRVGGNSQSHYGIAQVQTRDGLLGGRPRVPHVYTAMLRRGSAEGTAAPVSGPQLVGGALTGSLPRWLDYTFRVDIEGDDQHILYLVPKPDPGMGGRVQMLANPRIPMEGSKVKVPQMIKPASLVKGLEALQLRKDAAWEEFKEELGL